MSSDSGESPTSAHNVDEDEIDVGSPALESPTELQAEEEGAVEDSHGAQEDGEELASVGSGTNAMSFARRGSQLEQQEESASEPSVQAPVQRPRSPESTSTPDDTPSIQVSRGIPHWQELC